MLTKAIGLLVLTIMLTVIIDSAESKAPTIGFDTGQFDHLDVNDWPRIEAHIQTLFNYNNYYAVPSDVRGELARACNINWNQQQRVVIADDILRALKKLSLKPAAYFEEKEAPNISFPRILLELIYAYGVIADDINEKEWLQLMNNHSADTPYAKGIRELLFKTVEMHAKSTSLCAFLEKTMNDGELKLNETDTGRMKKVIEFHPIVAADTEKDFWEMLWNKYKPSEKEIAFSKDVYERVYLASCYAVQLRKARKPRMQYDQQVTFQIARDEKDFIKSYYFTLFTIDIARNNVGQRDSIVTPELMQQLEESILNQSESMKKMKAGKIEYSNEDHFKPLKESFLFREKRKIAEQKENERLKEESDRIEKVKREEQEKRVGTTQYVTMVPPEEQGEDFSILDNASVLTHLLTAEKYPVQTKAAKILGDRNIAGLFKPNDDEQQKIDNYVLETVLPWFKSDNPGDSGNARDQLARLWSLAVPSLLEAAKHNDLDNAYNALDALTAVRSEQVIQGLIDLYENSKGKENEQELKNRSIRSLGMLLNMRQDAVPYRPIPDSKDTKKLIDKIVSPFLRRISVKETDDTLHDAIKDAKDMLKNPADSRPKRVDGKPDEDEPAAEQEIHKQVVEAKQGEKQAEGEPIESPPAKVLANERQDNLGLFPFYIIGGFAVFVLLAVVSYFIWRHIKESRVRELDKNN